MWRIQRSLVLVAILTSGVAPVLALSEPAAEERDENRQLLEKWSADPEHWAQLQRNLAAFRALPSEQQDRLRRLDRDYRREDAATQARLQAALNRYTIWLGRLSEAERNEIKAAPTLKDRLHVIKKIRTREWFTRLPKADRQRLQTLADKDRLALALQIRQEQRFRRDEWQVALRFWKELMNEEPLPCRLTEFPPEVQAYVNDCLLRLLSDAETERLNKAAGHWPLYPRTLVELADRHPLSVPGPVGPTRLVDLHKHKLKFDEKKKGSSRERLEAAEGKWPEFGVVLRREIQNHYKKAVPALPTILPKEKCPATPDDFAPAVQQFLQQELLPALEPEDRKLLDQAKGRWPDYPKTVLDLARKHNLQVPGMTLPNPEYWDKFRVRS